MLDLSLSEADYPLFLMSFLILYREIRRLHMKFQMYVLQVTVSCRYTEVQIRDRTQNAEVAVACPDWGTENFKHLDFLPTLVVFSPVTPEHCQVP